MLLVFAMLLPLLSTAASAVEGRPERIDGIDYTLLSDNIMMKMPVEFYIGGRKFEGWLQNGGQSLTPEEQDEIIDRVMDEMKITSGMLAREKYLKEEVAKLSTFNRETLNVDAAADMLIKAIMSACKVDIAADVYKLIADDVTFVDGVIAVSNIGLGVGVGLAASIVFGPKSRLLKTGVDVLYAMGTEVPKHLASMMERYESVQDAVALTMKIKVFYAECNRQLLAEEIRRGNSGWSITCAHTVWCDKTLFGLPVQQYWRLKADLDRVSAYGDAEDLTNYSGIYRGSIVADIWHNLESYDENFQQGIFMSTPYAKISGIFKFTDEYTPSSLTKTLESYEVEVHVDSRNVSGGTTETTVSLKGFTDTSAFNTHHKIDGGLHLSLYNNGVFQMTGPYGFNYRNEVRIINDFKGGLLGGNRYPHLTLTRYDKVSKGHLSVMYYGTDTWDYSSGGPGGDLLTDYKIFSDLDSGTMKLVFKPGYLKEGKK